MNAQLPIELTFTVSERESLALAEQYYQDSPLHQRARSRTSWTLPVVLLIIMAAFVLQFGFAVVPIAIFVLGAVVWFILAPLHFDARMRSHTEQRLREPSYAKLFGTYSIRIDDKCLVSSGPTGYAEYDLDAVDRVVLTEEFLFIYLAGAMGYPVSVEQVGADRAKLAHDAVQQAISEAT